MRGPALRTDRTQTCLSCRATVRLPKSGEPLLCFRCRSLFREGVVAPGEAPFQKIASPAPRSPLNGQITKMLFALFLVVAAVMTLRGRSAPSSAESAVKPSPSQAPRRDGTANRQGGVDVILVGPTPRSSK